ncbi:hypothetical protein F5Y15DRAFT_397328 [Xylariaceae sp. FL0016]|nr:hypothetical protein F5Y15DRAFT_397328 [Xylariaceae sp. FL0016]
MCFSEFIGYTCGHTGIVVNRPCPLTTQGHNYPACKTPALRPFLIATMCSACTRVLHGRYHDLNEWEHQWKHARGACACNTKFPALQGPRPVGPMTPYIGGDDTEQGMMAHSHEF